MLNPPKIRDPLSVIKVFEKDGYYNFVHHARKRLADRAVTVLEISQVIERGFHEARKDVFRAEFGDWNYSIRGKTLDGRDIRLAIAIKSDGFLVITAIDLET